MLPSLVSFNTLRPRQNGRHFPDDIFKWIFLNESAWISIHISLKFVPRGPINNIPTLVQVMAWCRPGDKPLSEPMMVRLPTHICVILPQWVKLILFNSAQTACQLQNLLHSIVPKFFVPNLLSHVVLNIFWSIWNHIATSLLFCFYLAAMWHLIFPCRHKKYITNIVCTRTFLGVMLSNIRMELVFVCVHKNTRNCVLNL